MTAIAILEPQSLLGQEVRQGLDRLPSTPSVVRLLTREPEAAGTVTEVQGAAALLQTREDGCLDNIDLIFACGEPGDEETFARDLPDDATLILVGTAVSPATAAPLVAGVSGSADSSGSVISSPHPVVVLLAHLLAPLGAYALEEASACVTLPASAHGKVGIDEILDQVRSILTFSGERHEEVHGAQIAFNLLPSAQSEGLILEQLAAVLSEAGGSEAAPRISLRLSQAGIFHGLTAQLRVHLGRETNREEVREALENPPLVVSAEDPELLGPVDAAGREEVLLGRIDPAGDNGRSWWITAVMDNLTRGGGLNALELAEPIL